MSNVLSFHAASKEELALFDKIEYDNLTPWNAEIEHDMTIICNSNPFYKENHKQWGHKAGVNTGNAQLEARIPAKLFQMFLKKDENFIQDDHTWNDFINLFPRLRVMNS